MRTALFVLFFTQLVFGNAFAKSLIIPLKLENNLIEQVIKKQIFTDKKNALRINDDGSGCQFIELTQPKVKTDKNALKIRLSARVRFGQPVGDQQCLFFVKWNGYIDLYNNVKSFGKGKKVKISITKSELLTRQGKKDQLGDAVWQALKSQFYPKLRSLTIDLQTPINDIQGFLPHVITQRNNQQLQQALTSIAVNQIKVKPY
ncbi:MAG TPA: hypothetical protein ENK06_00915, partial [Gammaproteobacteria bacterium]|nr:hypothetical protein [Gammaproteobacteria bacterium]